MTGASNITDKNRKTTIELVLRPMQGERAKSSHGVIDPGLFTGENVLYLVQDTQTSFWYPKYRRGQLPEPFKQRFTSYNKLFDHVQDYLKKRNIEIVEIKD